jgi:antitoxin ParD1/3/4
MPTRNVNLTERLDAFIEDGVASGRYKNASEVVRAGLHLLEQRQQEDTAKLERLRAAVRAGEDAVARGEYVEVDEHGLRRLLAEHRASGHGKPRRSRG